MENAYAIGVTATLEDQVTPRLMSMVEWSEKANSSLLELGGTLRSMSGLSAAFARNLDKASAASTALGESSGGLTRASYVLDTMAASSADLARNMAAARAEGRGMGPGFGPAIPGGGGEGSRPGAGAASGGGGHVATAAGAAGAGLLWGIVENARLTDIVTRAVVTDGTTAAGQAAAVNGYMTRIREDAAQYGYAAHGLGDFAESYLSASRLLRGMPNAARMSIIDTILPYAAQESSMKGISLNESMSAMIGAAHMSGAYDQASIEAILPALISTSLSTNSSMAKIENAAGYAVPILRTGLGIEPSKVFTMIAMMQRAGINNSKSGTWIADLFMNAVPKNFGAGLFHSTNQIKALKELGLMDKANHLTYLDPKGALDPLKMLGIAAKHAALLTPIERASAEKQAFGTQGARALAIFTDPKMMAMLPMLEAAMVTLENPAETKKQLEDNNPSRTGKQAMTNFELMLTGASAVFEGPVNATLAGATSLFATAAAFNKDNPRAGAALDFGMIFGAMVAGMTTLSLAKGASGIIEKGAIGLSKFIARSAGGLIARSVALVTGEAIGAATIASAGGMIAVGAIFTGGVAWVLAEALRYTLNNAIPTAPPPPGWTPKGIDAKAVHGVTTGHPSNAHPQVHVAVQIDGNDVAAHVATKLISPNTLGPSGFNQSAAPLRPGMSSSN